MGTTADFLKLRSDNNPKLNEWNKDYEVALELSKKNNKVLITCWSNGDKCGYCTAAEKCMLTDGFKNWMKTSDCYFVFQYSGDSDGGKEVKKWIYNGSSLRYYPGFRITMYDGDKLIINKRFEGNTLRGSKSGVTGAKNMIDNLNKVLAGRSDDKEITPTPVKEDYKIRLNEKLTVKKVNAILDAIDKNDGYCPCQVESPDTKCHCKDFLENKKIGEPCICNIYVKQKK